MINIIFVLILISGITSLDLKLKSSSSGLINTVKNLMALKDKNQYLFKEAHIIQDIHSALGKVVVQHGVPVKWDLYRMKLWKNRKILRFGLGKEKKANGLKINVPKNENGEEYDVLWLRVLSDRHFATRVYYLDHPDTKKEIYTSGFRNLNEYSPDGTCPDSNKASHMWMDIPIRHSGPIILNSQKSSDSWISGIAFGKNLWGHARNSAQAYHWANNGGTKLKWGSNSYHNDVTAQISPKKISTLKVPVVENGKDKFVYLIEQNDAYIGNAHQSVTVNGKGVERFRTTFNNAFATHHNSKKHSKYIATKVKADLIPKGAQFIDVAIDLTLSNKGLLIREVGTHDA